MFHTEHFLIFKILHLIFQNQTLLTFLLISTQFVHNSLDISRLFHMEQSGVRKFNLGKTIIKIQQTPFLFLSVKY